MKTRASQTGQPEAAVVDQRPQPAPSIVINQFHEYLTADETIVYLRLDARGGNARERLRNLERRHQLPSIKKGGGLHLYRKSEIDDWLAGRRRGRPARLGRPAKAAQGVTSNC
jgi:hypothetical protein